MDAICRDLAAEHDALDRVVAELAPAQWARSTPAEGWTIGDQISHLWYFDRAARLAALDPEAFSASVADLLATAAAGLDPSVECGRALDPVDLLTAWRADRVALLDTLSSLDPAARIPWYGPAMGARSFATARLMETWAHGQDIRDALGHTPEQSPRLRHVAHIGVRARPFSYAVRGLSVPEGDVGVELAGPDGEAWVWGESDVDVVSGSALDFCLLVTQRRNVADTDLKAVGSLASEWLGIAQAFAGPPGPGRAPGQFRDR